MTRRPSLAAQYGAALTIALALASARQVHGQADPMTPRAAVPVPEFLRRAIAAGTRDSSGVPGPRYWQLFVDYDLAAELDPQSAEIVGTGQISLVNPSPRPLTEIRFRLDQNRFRPENAPRLPAASQTMGVTVTELRVNGMPARIGGAPTDARPILTNQLSTNATLLLDQPVVSGELVRIDIAWRFTVPLDESGQALRLGRQGTELYQIAQWYPRVAMLDDLHGWDTTTYSGDAEFYNPFARFNVRLRVPDGWLVGASGVLQNPEAVLSVRMRERLAAALQSDSVVEVSTRDETLARSAAADGGVSTWHFRADSVSDFAWGTSARYGWTSARALVAGREPVALHFLRATPASAASASVMERMRDNLVMNSRLLFPYRFPQHTLVDGPEGGMEYPMLTMSSGDGRLSHELWHQWFPITVGSDESRYTFLDEGFATFLAGMTTAVRMSDPPEGSRPLQRPPMQVPLISPDRAGESDLLAALYGYGRVSPMLRALADSVGHDRMIGALRAYAVSWSLKHPSPWDFMFFMNRTLNHDFSAFWHRWIFTTAP